jgi:hypothetical protein
MALRVSSTSSISLPIALGSEKSRPVDFHPILSAPSAAFSACRLDLGLRTINNPRATTKTTAAAPNHGHACNIASHGQVIEHYSLLSNLIALCRNSLLSNLIALCRTGQDAPFLYRIEREAEISHSQWLDHRLLRYLRRISKRQSVAPALSKNSFNFAWISAIEQTGRGHAVGPVFSEQSHPCSTAAYY